MLKEDPRERAIFDRNTIELYSGDAMAQVHQTLTTMSATAPQGGTFAKLLAVCANEIEKARVVPPRPV